MELVDIVDENNELTGQVEDRWVAYNKGLWRRTVSCWIMNEKGEVLLQKRTANKRRNPNKWAKTGGQVEAKETVEEAIYREVKEELGIETSKEQIIIKDIHKSNDKNKRFAYNFIFVVKHQISDYVLQKEEVADVKYVTIEEMESAKKNNDMNYTFYNWSDEDFYREMELLKNQRQEIVHTMKLDESPFERIKNGTKLSNSYRYTYNKLVRDKIPENINNEKGRKCQYRILDDVEYLKELNKKVLEETNEFIEENSIEELGDLLEVINAIMKLKGYDMKEVNKVMKAKEEKKGAFNNKIFLEYVDEEQRNLKEEKELNKDFRK